MMMMIIIIIIIIIIKIVPRRQSLFASLIWAYSRKTAWIK